MTIEFLTIPEACEILRLGERTVYELCRQGRLGGAVKIGNQWRIEKSVFEQWVRQGAGEVPPKPGAKRGKKT